MANDWEAKISEIVSLHDLQEIVIIVSENRKELATFTLDFPAQIYILPDEDAEARTQIYGILREIQ